MILGNMKIVMVLWKSLLTCIWVVIENVVVAGIVDGADILEYWWWCATERSKCWLKTKNIAFQHYLFQILYSNYTLKDFLYMYFCLYTAHGVQFQHVNGVYLQKLQCKCTYAIH